jgi:hypothetical protein
MKLIFCPHCEDIRKLSTKKVFCKCKASSGYYKKDGLHAVIGGAAIPLGISNISFIKALQEPKSDCFYGPRFEAWIIPDCSDTVERKDENKIKGSFEEHLEWCEAQVELWPEWKKKIL